MVKLSKLELQVMEVLWAAGSASIREIQQLFAAKSRPAYTTVQTIVYRLEAKKAVKRTKRVGNADIFEPQVSRNAVHRRLIEDFLSLFGGQTGPVIAHFIESGRLTKKDIDEAEAVIAKLAMKEKSK